jgi:DNA processing protein
MTNRPARKPATHPSEPRHQHVSRPRHAPNLLLPAPGDITPSSVMPDVQWWLEQDYRFLTIMDPDYPEWLGGIHQAPPILFARGTVIPDDQGVSIVGSRDASPRGRSAASDLARELVGRGLTVISGLARGIDTAAHRAALDAGGRTVAVMGTGINVTYPPENSGLRDEIAERGLVLSQFWPDASPQKHTFLMRNATMSGYGLASVVVEAGEFSGARAQARMALEHGRQVILTQEVVARNEWARSMLGRPAVHVADGIDAILRAVEDIIAMWAEIREVVDPCCDDRLGQWPSGRRARAWPVPRGVR